MSGFLFIAVGSLPFLAVFGRQMYLAAREDFSEFKETMLHAGLLILLAAGACLMCYGASILKVTLGGR